MREPDGRFARREQWCFDERTRWIVEERDECLDTVVSDWKEPPPVGELIECKCESCADDTRRDVGSVDRVSVMLLHVGRRKGMTVNFLPRMVAVFVFACLLLQNARPTLAAFTTGNVKKTPEINICFIQPSIVPGGVDAWLQVCNWWNYYDA